MEHTTHLKGIERLTAIMARLRDPENGCPWDIQQDFASIAPYTIEEAYEVADAIERGDMPALQDELGDLMLQVVFHSQIAKEAGHFALEDVITSISDKMVRRHPHVFASITADTPEAVIRNWEDIKAAERDANTQATGALAGVAIALPALQRAQKLQKRAARVGFDWPDSSGAKAKIAEEMEEVAQAKNADERAEEIGDLLFAVVNYARHLQVDAELALKAANQKFERRFAQMETISGADFPTLPLHKKEELWIESKQLELRLQTHKS